MSKIYNTNENLKKLDIVQVKRNCAIIVSQSPNFSNLSRINSSSLSTGLCSTTDLEGNVYILGLFKENIFSNNIYLSNSDKNGIFIAPLGADGEWQWARKIFTYDSNSTVSLNFDILFHKGNIYAAGVADRLTVDITNDVLLPLNSFNNFILL